MSATAVGIVGVGNMGAGMARRLLATGHAVTVRDLLPAREALAAGARVAASPAALARDCGVVIVAVVDAAQTEAVLFGNDGVAAGARAGTTLMLCPTIAPDDVEHFAQRLQAAGLAVIDAPMSGGPARAEDGTMSLMVACADDVFARHEPLLRTLAQRLVRIGNRVGDGARTKLVNNLLAAIHLAGAAEALALARRLGLDGEKTLAVIEASSAQSWIASDRLPRALAGDLAPRAHTTLLAKDSALAMAMAAAAGAEPALGREAAAIFRSACDAGFGALDDASLLSFLERGSPPA